MKRSDPDPCSRDFLVLGGKKNVVFGAFRAVQKREKSEAKLRDFLG